MEKLRRVREANGWTIQETARRSGVSWQSIKNLEEPNGDTRPGDSEKTTAATVNALLEVFHPALKLRDFVPHTNLMVLPASIKASRRIEKIQE